jgi:hypothetical protein
LLVVALTGCGRLGFEETSRPPDVLPDAALDVRGPGTWTATPPSPLAPRVWINAVWTGADFLVFGGALDAAFLPTDTGARFDPVRWEWKPLPGGPAARHTAKLAVVDNLVIEYGGGVGFGPTGGGAKHGHDRPVEPARSNVPGSVYSSTLAVGPRVLVWGGWRSASSHLHRISKDLCARHLTLVGTTAPARPQPRAPSDRHRDRGCDGSMPSCANVFGDGASYDPALDTWTVISTVNAPSPRAQHASVWTGRELFVFGGTEAANESVPTNTGGRYSPETDSWRPISTVGAPSPRVDAGP